MKKTIEELLEAPYWIIDILPEQVPADSPGQYFEVERYYLEEPRRSEIKKKHIDLVLKLSCYRKITVGEGAAEISPGELAEEMMDRHINIMVSDSMIVSEPDDLYMTLYGPDEKLLELIKTIASREGLFVWGPEDEA